MIFKTKITFSADSFGVKVFSSTWSVYTLVDDLPTIYFGFLLGGINGNSFLSNKTYAF